ncbi:MAG: glycoside hydrolase family 18 protein, partial [Planctomycetota bacterium]
CWAQSTGQSTTEEHAAKPAIVGYLPDYRLSAAKAESLRGLTDLILFSAEIRLDGSLDLNRLHSCPWSTIRTATRRQKIKLILSIGGWERSKHFATVAASPPKLAQFAKSVVQFCKKHELDGVDIDWEHPKNAQEEGNYAILLKTLKTAFQPDNLTLSVTIATWQRLTPEAIADVDRIQIMAYDYGGEHSEIQKVELEIGKLLDAGFPAEKMILGLPFYGRDVLNRTATSYADIVEQYRPAANVDRIGNLYFNGPKTIEDKFKLALDRKLGGVMIWEIGQDARGNASLLKTLRDSAKRNSQ